MNRRTFLRAGGIITLAPLVVDPLELLDMLRPRRLYVPGFHTVTIDPRDMLPSPRLYRLPLDVAYGLVAVEVAREAQHAHMRQMLAQWYPPHRS